MSPADRVRLLEQRGCVVWLTGLSGSGKSALAQAMEKRLVSVVGTDGHLHIVNGPSDRSLGITKIRPLRMILTVRED